MRLQKSTGKYFSTDSLLERHPGSHYTQVGGENPVGIHVLLDVDLEAKVLKVIEEAIEISGLGGKHIAAERLAAGVFDRNPELGSSAIPN